LETSPLWSLLNWTDSLDDLRELWNARTESMTPEPSLTVSEWADERRMLPETAAEPGRWRTRRAPYLKAIMDALSPSHPAEFVSVMKGSQLGFTECGNNWIGYVIDYAPGTMLIVNPGLNEVKRNTATRIDPLIESTPSLKRKVVPHRSREAGNSIFRKKFPGGELVMTGANSAVGLRSLPARYLFMDEVDGYPGDANEEGDPVDLAVRRTATYRGRRKIFSGSTPTIKGISRIEKAVEGSDTIFKYFVPCKHCGEYDVIAWGQIRFPRDEDGTYHPEDAVYVCRHCEGAHGEADKTFLLEGGEWRAIVEGEGRSLGFYLPGLLSPFEPWEEQVRQFLEVKDDSLRLKVWVNTVLGETYEEQGDAPEWERLYALREDYKQGRVPQGGLLLTAGVDVQVDRLELEIVAWGEHNESWSVDYLVLGGDTSNIDDPVWGELDQVLGDSWAHEETGVRLTLRRLAIDEGYNTQIVRAWARRHGRGHVMVCKGQDHAAAPTGQPTRVDIDLRGKKIARGMLLWPVGVSILKSELYGWLRLNPPTDEALEARAEYPAGYCHFPQYGREYFEQLTAEQRVARVVKGFRRLEWVKTRERNEALDCRVLARAAAWAIGVDRWGTGKWQELRDQIEGEQVNAEGTVPTPRRRRRRRAVSSYMRS